MNKILIIDDDHDMCMLLSRFLTRKGYETITMHNGKTAIEWVNKNKPDLILCDFRLEDMTGAKLLQNMKEIHPNVPAIIITGYSDVKDAVEVMKIGAYDYITKPLLPEEILITIQKALTHDGTPGTKTFKPENANSQKETTQSSKSAPAPNNSYVAGSGPEFANILKQINLVAPTNYSVIIYGESGSGKEVIAHQIHKNSSRKDKPFVAIDCGALSKELAGSELFGHEKGAFTGALFQKTGSFEVANGGTIFLDEIANLSYDIQISLLRVIQERKIKRLGSTKDIPLDVRIIVASNERLWNATRENKFREDLYHRFNEFSIEVPPLRDRKSDIMLFANYFLKQTNEELGKHVEGFTKEVERIFSEYVWYGNLRELKNVIKRATLLADDTLIDVKCLPFEISNFQKLQFDSPDNDTLEPEQITDTTHSNRLKNANLDAQYEVILDVLKQTNYNKTKAAKMLNIDRKTLYNKLSQYNLLKAK